MLVWREWKYYGANKVQEFAQMESRATLKPWEKHAHNLILVLSEQNRGLQRSDSTIIKIGIKVNIIMEIDHKKIDSSRERRKAEQKIPSEVRQQLEQYGSNRDTKKGGCKWRKEDAGAINYISFLRVLEGTEELWKLNAIAIQVHRQRCLLNVFGQAIEYNLAAWGGYDAWKSSLWCRPSSQPFAIWKYPWE